MLAWAGQEFGEAIARAGAMDDLKWKVKWAADHVIAAHPEEFVFAAFLGNSTDDFDYYGPVEYYEQYNKNRTVGYVTKSDPGSEVLADAAATLAAAVLLLANDTSLAAPAESPETDVQAWRAEALGHARSLYAWAKTDPASYAEAKGDGLVMMSEMYPSNNGFWDDLSWAATWMYKATGEQEYLADAISFLEKSGGIKVAATFETGYKTPGAAVLLAGVVGTAESQAFALSKDYFDQYLDGNIAHTKAGAAYPYHWGALRHVGNLGFLTHVHGRNPTVDPGYQARLINYGAHQTNYLLGDAGRSWIVGFGENYPQFLHHKMSYNSILTWQKYNEPLAEKVWMLPADIGGPWAPENKGNASGQYIQRAKFDFEGSRRPQQHTAWGTVFGAPLYDDGIINARRDYTYAEPTVEYNSGAFGAVAAMADWYASPAWIPGSESLSEVIPFSCSAAAATPAATPATAPALAPSLVTDSKSANPTTESSSADTASSPIAAEAVSSAMPTHQVVFNTLPIVIASCMVLIL